MAKKADKLLQQALDACAAGRVDEARATYERLLVYEPLHLDGNYLLGTLHAERGDTERAFAHLLKASSVAPDSPLVNNNLGNVFRTVGRDVEATDRYQRAVAAMPDLGAAHHSLAILQKKAGRISQAEASFRMAARLMPANADVLLGLAECMLQLGRQGEARNVLERVVQLEPDHPAAAHMLAAAAGESPDAPPATWVKWLFDRGSATFDEHLVEQLRYRGPEMLAAAVAAVAGEDARFESAVDLGCGTGLVGLKVRSAVGRLVGVDLSPRMLEVAAARGIYDACDCADVVEFLTRDASAWDLILAGDVLIYVGRLEALFRAAERATRPGALFAFTVETIDDGDVRLTPSGRYAHSNTYVCGLAAACSFDVVHAAEGVLRLEGGKPVPANTLVLRRR